MIRRTGTVPLTLLSTLVATLWLGACDHGMTEVNESAELVPIHVVAYAIGVPLSTLVLEVTAADISPPLIYNLEVVAGVASDEIRVPPGEARTFLVSAYDDQGNVTHEGSATVDVTPGTNSTLTVKLKPQSGKVPITVSFDEYIVSVAPSSDSLDANVVTEIQLTATVIDADSQIVMAPKVQWATTDPHTATVSDDGLVAGVTDGPVTIVASFEGVAGLSQLQLLNFPATQWVEDTIDTGGLTQSFYGVWANPAIGAYAVGSAGKIIQYDDDVGVWYGESTPFVASPLFDFWGSSSTDLYAVGANGIIMHNAGSGWVVDTVGTRHLNDVWGSSPTDVFVVGDSGSILHFDGTAWSQETVGTQLLRGVCGLSSTDVFAVGDNHTVLHYNGTSWTAQDVPYGDFRAVWCGSSTNVYAVGYNGQIFQYDGSSWNAHSVDGSPTLFGVWGASASDIYAVGANGVILHYNGDEWLPQPSWTTELLWGVSGFPATDVFVVGGSSYKVLHGTR